MIKVSDYIVKFISHLGVKHVFTVSGAGDLHILNSIHHSKDVSFICNHHEQASAMAAFAYSRATKNIGVCLVTTGPGATNAITGMIDCWVDSVPGLYISGQVQRKYMINDQKIRQCGIQEINIIDMVKPVTKFAAVIDDPLKVRWYLEKAVSEAKYGRPGPSWLDIPLDVQSAFVEESELEGYNVDEMLPPWKKITDETINNVIELLKQAKRPVFLIGHGIKAAGAEEVLSELCDLLPIPLCVSWNGIDLINTDHPRYIGRFGTYGQRGANFTVQNSDLFLSVGSRLNITQTGYVYEEFAREAKKIYVDIDKAELDKFPVQPDLSIHCDAKIFLQALVKAIKIKQLDFSSINLDNWVNQCVNWKLRYPVNLPEYKSQKKYINSFDLIDVLTSELGEHEIIIPTASGSGFTSFHQAANIKKGQIVFTSNGFAEMGFDIPGAIGAAIATGKTIWQTTGDGGIQMNIQELQTLVYYQLPVKIFIHSNKGYLTIRHTQNGLFNGFYSGSDFSSGVSLPDFEKLAAAYGIPYFKADSSEQLPQIINDMAAISGPCICEVIMDPQQPLVPKTSFKILDDGKLVSPPIEDLYPFLDREEFFKNMIIAPINF